MGYPGGYKAETYDISAKLAWSKVSPRIEALMLVATPDNL